MTGGLNTAVETTKTFDFRSLDQCRTVLHDNDVGLPYLTYTGVQWIIRARKEVLLIPIDLLYPVVQKKTESHDM